MQKRPSEEPLLSLEFPQSRIHLEAWLTIAKHAKWKTYLDVRQSFPGTDPVKVASGKTVYVFNFIGNAYRMICAIHFNTGKVFMLRFMTHANYSKEKWKNEL